MKKFVVAIIASMMVMSLAGCGKTGIGAASDWVSSDENITAYELDDGSYYYEGAIGSTMRTAWFDYSIDSAYTTTDSIGGYTPDDGNALVVVEMTIKNTFNQSIPMSNWDFDIEWGDGDYDFAYPIEVSEPVMTDQFPSEYTLESGKTRSGYLIFEVPEGTEDFGVGFVEYYEDETEGNGFWVYFTADEK